VSRNFRRSVIRTEPDCYLKGFVFLPFIGTVSRARVTIELRPLMIGGIVVITTNYYPCAVASSARDVP
jgi:hypothetical protein